MALDESEQVSSRFCMLLLQIRQKRKESKMSIPRNGLEYFTVPCDGGCMGTGFVGQQILCPKCHGVGRILIDKALPKREVTGADVWTWLAIAVFIVVAGGWLLFGDR
jgi:hypothetical protein